MSDAKLLHAYATHADQAAFAEIVRRHVGLVHGVARRELRDAHLAEDVTQAVFLMLQKKAAALVDHPCLPGWLFQSARLVAANARRRERRRLRTETHAAKAAAMTTNQNPQTPDLAASLNDALAHLAEKDRHVLLLRYYQDFGHDEIAAAIGTSADAAQKRVSRAVEKLRAALAHRGVAAPAAAVAAFLASELTRPAPPAVAAGALTPTPSAAILARPAAPAKFFIAAAALVVAAFAWFILQHFPAAGPAPAAFVSTSTAAVPAAATATATTSKKEILMSQRILHFPAQRVGIVWSRPASNDFGKGWSEPKNIGFAEVGPAQGDVPIPADHDASLECDQPVDDLGAALTRLAADDLQFFSIRFGVKFTLTENDVRALTRLKGLKSLDVHSADIGDDVLPAIAEMENLRTLNLTSVERTTDDGFAALQKLTKIEKFFGGNARQTDKSFAVVMRWADTLKEARFGGMKVSDDAFTHIMKCRNLAGLHAPRTVGAEGFKALELLPIDRLIMFNNPNIDDAALATLAPILARMDSLRFIDLDWTKITDAGVMELARCKQLTGLQVRKHTGVTEECERRLAAELPNCKLQ